MESPSVAQQFAKQLALMAFAVISLQGLWTTSPIEVVLPRALVISPLFFVLGFILGELARWVVEDNVRTELERIRQQSESQSSPAPT